MHVEGSNNWLHFQYFYFLNHAESIWTELTQIPIGFIYIGVNNGCNSWALYTKWQMIDTYYLTLAPNLGGKIPDKQVLPLPFYTSGNWSLE